MFVAEKTYPFDTDEYDENGFHKKLIDFTFWHFADLCQKLFYKEFKLVANYLFYSRTAEEIFGRLSRQDPVKYGMELIEGDLNFGYNHLLDEFGEKDMVYGLGNVIPGHEEEPVWLVIDDCLPPGEIRLAYDDDDDDDGGGGGDDDDGYVPDPDENSLSLSVAGGYA